MLRAIAATLLANLPVRWWGPLEERLPLYSMAPAAGLLTMLMGVGLGISGFINYLQAATDGVNKALIGAQSDLVQIRGWGLLSLPAFLLTTPLGLSSLYLTMSGLVRAAGAFLAGDVHGDFILSGIDRLGRRLWGGARTYDARKTREKREGADVADRLVSGSQLGRPEMELVVLTARRRPEWTVNSYLVSSDGSAYRIGAGFDFDTAGGLRTGYPLTLLRGGEAIRHSIAYELPSLSRGPVHSAMNN